MSKPIPTLGADIRALRRAAALSQNELARLLGTSQGQLSRIEKGEVRPHLDFLIRAGEVLNANLEVRLTADELEADEMPGFFPGRAGSLTPNVHASDRAVPVVRYREGQAAGDMDTVAVEEPLEIRLGWTENGARKRQAISVTMRTPGNDFELAAGFVYGERIVESGRDIAGVEYCRIPANPGEQCNTVAVQLRDGLIPDLKKQKRNFTTTSACGVCGKASLEALAVSGCAIVPVTRTISPEVIYRLPSLLRDAQEGFDASGGVHASGLFEFDGTFVDLAEDVGRHNAFDKLVGKRVLSLGEPAMEDRVVVLSGRASFELLQKALVARVPVVVALGAPSSLAVQMARSFNITLTGFTKASGFNVYSGEERIRA